MPRPPGRSRKGSSPANPTPPPVSALGILQEWRCYPEVMQWEVELGQVLQSAAQRQIPWPVVASVLQQVAAEYLAWSSSLEMSPEAAPPSLSVEELATAMQAREAEERRRQWADCNSSR